MRMNIEWNRVTKLSQAIAILLGLLIFALGFWLGTLYAPLHPAPVPAGPLPVADGGKISDVTYECSQGRAIHALFYEDKVTLMLSDGRTFNLPHVISGSGARYASEDESVVFWEKGPSATLTEGTEDGGTENVECAEAPIPE